MTLELVRTTCADSSTAGNLSEESGQRFPCRVHVVDSVNGKSIDFTLDGPWPERRDLRLDELANVSSTVRRLIAAQGEIHALILLAFYEPDFGSALMELVTSRPLQRELKRRLWALGCRERLEGSAPPRVAGLHDNRAVPWLKERVDEFDALFHSRSLHAWHAYSLLLCAVYEAREVGNIGPSLHDIADLLRAAMKDYTAAIDHELVNFEQAIDASINRRLLNQFKRQLDVGWRTRCVAERFQAGSVW